MMPGTSAELDKAISFLQGDAFGGIPTFRIRVRGATPSVAVASVKWQFKTDIYTTTISATIDSGSGITITDANLWTFSIPDQVIALNYSETPYVWGMLFTDANGLLHTYLSGTATVGPKLVIP